MKIKIDPLACEVIKKQLDEKKMPLAVRIEIRSTGCCDASLGLAAAQEEANDIIEKIDGLSICMGLELWELVSDVFISYVNDVCAKGFILTSKNPLNEWAGFAAGSIRFE